MVTIKYDNLAAILPLTSDEKRKFSRVSIVPGSMVPLSIASQPHCRIVHCPLSIVPCHIAYRPNVPLPHSLSAALSSCTRFRYPWFHGPTVHCPAFHCPSVPLCYGASVHCPIVHCPAVLSYCPFVPRSMVPLSHCPWSRFPFVPLCQCAIVHMSFCHIAPMAISQSPHGRIALASHCPSVRPIALRWP
jgi:hypothetical protein